ncbi:hypothetical protein HY251_01675, partial [bacterium]|nr:hypothetical protein [bacterium]
MPNEPANPKAALAGLLLLALLATPLALGVSAQEAPRTDRHAYNKDWESEPGSSGCVACHKGVEEVHPEEQAE